MTEKALESLMKTENVEMVWAALHQKEIDPAEVETLVRLYVDKLEARLKFREAGRVFSRVASTEEEKKALVEETDEPLVGKGIANALRLF